MFDANAAQRGIPPTPYDIAIIWVTEGDWQKDLLIRAIISKESAWNPNAINPEPGKASGPSYGLMQVTLPTARLFYSDLSPEDLMDPATNIAVGGLYLTDLLARYQMTDAISAYNAGSPRRSGGQYVNQSYVNDVLTYYTYFQNTIPAPPASTTPPSGEGLTLDDVISTMTGFPFTLLGLALLLLPFLFSKKRR